MKNRGTDMNEPILRFLGALALTTAILSTTITTNAAEKPNVVIIFVDDLGWTDLGCYGSAFYETPNIDRLAGQGAMFIRAYTSCCVCSPTRASLMTGKYPQRVGFTTYLEPGKLFGANSVQTHLPHPHEGHGRQPCQVISQDGWNLIHYIEANETELYNLDIDQSERNNLAQAEPERTREMLETLNQWVQRTRRY